MTVKKVEEVAALNLQELIGLSTDAKPTNVNAGSTFKELDGLKKFYVFDGTNWINTIIPTTTDDSGYSVYISPEHHRLHKGQAFSATSILANIAAGGSIYLEYVVPANKTVAVQGFNIESDKLIKSEFYEAPTVTDGTTEIPIIQRYRESNNVAEMKIYNNPTEVSGGTLLRTLVYGVVDGQGNSVRPLPPSGSDPYGFNLKANTKYIVKLTNMSAATTTLLYFNVDIYEF